MEALAADLNQTQQDLQKLILERQRLETQLHESKIVKLEFDQLADDAKIYKMIGPVLVPQDKVEADTNVSKRLEFIETQIKGVEEKLNTMQASLQKKQQEFQAKAQAEQAQAQAQAA